MGKQVCERVDEITGEREPVYVLNQLPSDRHKRACLVFQRVAIYQGHPEAVFSGACGLTYSVDPAPLCEARQEEQKKQQAGEPGYDLPYFQLAQNQLRYAVTLYKARRFMKSIPRYSLYAVGVAAASAAALSVAGVLSEFKAKAPFNAMSARDIEGTVFKVSISQRTAATGSPDTKGISWTFSKDRPHKACIITPAPAPQSTPERLFALAHRQECRPMTEWPDGSEPQRLYAPAYTAYLQAAKPKEPPQLEDVRRALANKRAAEAVRLP